ncbi:hypothetical protein GA0115240_105824 [Streptomyces sp. DvalAA-14]|uniref:hypothetical protein n=1 Tax=unclassified Streptomyces TaxID=2593676 RepID=UPI00081BA1BB|nr:MULTISPECIES: hypothetical protein [unclassified Streptomyces]MYS19171.1 hypothetical protein [Streptomyces sp. SID4948]SCD38291.1 hypothetical protein GA0115240_105824 [Streptomyces sp. DvalAA-14]
MSVSGSGGSLGEAILAAIAAAAGTDRRGEYRSYTAVGWHAQLTKLTSSPRGYQAAADAGVSATAGTLRRWLSETQTPQPAMQARIAAAYERMAGRWPAALVEGEDIRIHGTVKVGTDERMRGGNSGTAALIIDGSQGSWDTIRDLWRDGEPDPDDVEEEFVAELLEPDLGETTEPWEFPGTSYTVVIG